MSEYPLKDPKLLVEQCFVDGKWISSGETFEVKSPFTGIAIGKVPSLTKSEVEQAVETTHRAFESYRKTPPAERAALLKRWADLMDENRDDLAKIMTLEQGKVYAEALGEIDYGTAFVRWFSEEAVRIYGDVIEMDDPALRGVVIKQPIGPVGAITPWNFPSAMITRKCAPALAVGCTAIVKPSSETPFSALALARLAERAGFPPGVFNVVTGASSVIGEVLASTPLLRKLSFTGSTEVGKQLMQGAAGTVKKVSLELGGNAPFIVFDDADIEQAVSGAIASRFRNSGQTCISANRLYVQSGIHDRFVEALVAAVKELKTGGGMEKGITQGPLINDAAAEKVKRLVADAKGKGATVAHGGNGLPSSPRCFESSVITGVTEEMEIAHEEIFGPVASVIRFESEEEVVAKANATRMGLASYFYTQDLGRIWRMSEALEYGMVGANSVTVAEAKTPFGGVKESGIGREGSKYGVDDFIETKFIAMGLGNNI